jgi:flagellar basal-body rod modification protein FlgD
MAVDGISRQKTIEEIVKSTENKSGQRKVGELGKDEFLNLLVTQLRYQDPLNPVEDKEFIAQMAQFSALEQMQNLNASFSATKAFGMIGKYITATMLNESTFETETIEGMVDSVKMEGSKTYLVVGDKDVPVEKVVGVSEDSGVFNNSNISQYTGIIGYEVKGYVYNSETGEIVGVNGVVREIDKGRYENYAVMDGVKVKISAVATGSPSADSEFWNTYLTESKDHEVSLIITDEFGDGTKVPVTGVLRDFTIAPDGKITGVLDEVYVPVESIYNIKEQVREVEE